MLEELINLVKQNAGDAIVNNPAIPNEHNNSAIEETAKSIMNSLKGNTGGNMNALGSLFNSGGNVSSNPLTSQVTGDVATQLMNKFGISSQAAGSVVSQLIPTVMNQLVHKTNDPNDSSFNISGIMNALGAGSTGGLVDKLKGMFGA